MTTREHRLRWFNGKCRELQKDLNGRGESWMAAIIENIADELAAILAEPVEMSEEFLGAMTRIYAVGYLSGHEDTVEGCYTDVVYSDRPTYHRDVVTELLQDSDYAALNLKEP